MKIIKKHKIFLAILVLGIFLRSYKAMTLFYYGHDQDLLSWFVIEIVNNHDVRLIGQETSRAGVFIGPLFYYLSIPFYLLTNMSPAGTVLLPIIISVFTIYSYYYIFEKIFSKKIGLISALVHSVSYVMVFTEREVVPTQPVFLWSVWFFYCVYLVSEGENNKALPILGILAGLVWHINLALGLGFVVIILAYLISANKKFSLNKLLISAFLGLILISPFILFELRNNFLQINAILNSGSGIVSEFDNAHRLNRVLTLGNKNINRILFDTKDYFKYFWLIASVVLLIIYNLLNIIPKKLGILSLVWVGLLFTFFVFNKINLSEYYLNSLSPIWIMVISITFGALSVGILNYVGVIFISLFLFLNVSRVLKTPNSSISYLEKVRLIDEIDRDRLEKGYPCIAISYITNPGYDFGYRYLFRYKNMHVNLPKSLSPVYTIVFPLGKIEVDKTFGSLGLIYPDYERYNSDDVDLSCSGENSNITDPLFGFTN